MVRTKPTLIAMAVLSTGMLLSIWAVSGCGQSRKARPATISRWEQTLRGSVLAEIPAPVEEAKRSIAESGPLCLKDRATGNSLRQEVQRLEAKRGGQPARGTVLNKDLSTFSPAQGQFLSTNSTWITDAVDYSSCSDVPCMLNLLYGNAASDAGWYVYGYYLRTGIMAGCRDKIPGLNTTQLGYSSYLFKEKELLSLWMLSFALPPAYRSLPTLQSIHRLPTGMVPSDWRSGQNDTYTCGDAGGGKTSGFIRLSDQGPCFGYSDRYSQDADTVGFGGKIHKLLAHEITHRVDYRLGKNYEYFSDHSDEWMAFSGWYRETVTDPDTGRTYSQWKSNPEKEGFVREYAGTSPIEDFAETAAYVRFTPDASVLSSPKKTAFLSKLLFDGRTFTAEGMARFYEDFSANRITPQLVELAYSCVNGPSRKADSTAGVVPANHLLFESPVTEPMVSCLERGLNDRITEALNELRATEWEACDSLKTHEASLRAKLFVRLNPDITRLVAEQAAIAPLLKATEQLNKALRVNVDPREAYIHCYRSASPDVCYQAALGEAFDRVAQPFEKLLADRLSKERETFLSSNTLTKSGAQVAQFYRQVFAGIEPTLEAAAVARWEGCEVSPLPPAGAPASLDQETGINPLAPAAPVLTTPFSGGTRFIAAPILTCVNSDAADDVRKTRDRFIQRLGLSVADPDVQVYTFDMLLPSYLAALKQRLEEAFTQEEAIRERARPAVVAALRAGLLKKSSWSKGAADPEGLKVQCLPVAQAAFDSYFAAQAADALPARFAAIEDVRRTWSGDACDQALTDPALSAAMKDAKSRAWATALKDLEGMLTTRADDKATDCKARNPAKTTAAKSRRKTCLTGAWAQLESAVLDEWQRTPRGTGKLAEGRKQLANRRSVLQTGVIQRMESR